MRLVIQRATAAEVRVDGTVIGAIDAGLVILVGVGLGDSETIATTLAEKIAHLRIFEDAAGKMNRSALDVHAELLVVSQFTLYADAARGRRPSFTGAAPPDQAAPLVDHFVATLRGLGLTVATGQFGAHMQVSLVNDGPVTIILEG